jgi:TatD DNase family protein
MTVSFIDTHTHLDHCEPADDVLVQEALAAGVDTLIQSGTDAASSLVALELAQRFAPVFATVGIHPHDAAGVDPAAWDVLEQLVAEPKVVGVGETGLDFYRDLSPREAQEAVFLRHIDLARRTDLPLVIHTREAEERTLELLAAHARDLTVILHCFSMPARLDEVVARGYYLSFAGNVTYKNAAGLREAAARVPAHLILVETDAPYLSPEPLRGRPNAPDRVVHTYRFLARQRKMEMEELAAGVGENARRAYPGLRWAV